MKKLLFILLLIPALLQAQTKLTYKTSEVQAILDRSNATPLYIIEKVGSTYYARPGRGLTTYSNADATVVIQSALNQMNTGGLLFIKNGLYDGMDSILIPYDNITIQGEGKYNTILKLKANFDAGKSNAVHGFIQVNGKDKFVLKSIQVDGNGLNQTYRDDGDAEVNVGRICCITLYNSGADTCKYPLIEDCYIKDATIGGIDNEGYDVTIRKCYFEGGYWYGIASQVEASKLLIEDCQVTASDIGFDINSSHTIIRDCLIENMNSSYSSGTYREGIGIENVGGYCRNILISRCKIKGPANKVGVHIYLGNSNITVENCVIDSIEGSNGYGILSDRDSLLILRGNLITNFAAQGIRLTGVRQAIIQNNYLDGGAGSVIAMNITNFSTTYTVNSFVSGNYIQSAGAGLNISANCNNNVFFSNILYGPGWEDRIIEEGTTGLIWRDNLGKTLSTLFDDTP